MLADARHYLKEGTIVDATFIDGQPTKISQRKRPEAPNSRLSSVLCLKAHIGVDARTVNFTRSTTAAKRS